MDRCRKTWEVLFFCFLCWRTGCCMKVMCNGVLWVEPADTVVSMGSELTVLCRSYNKQCGRRFSISLNQQPQTPLQVLNCSTVRLRLANVSTPKSELICRVSNGSLEQTVCGMVLLSGFPPEKPTGIRCFATKDSENVSCTWNKGRQTHILTSYSVTFQHKNGAQSFHVQSQNESALCVPRSMFDGNGEYNVSVRAENDLGESASDVVPLSVADLVIPSTPKIIAVEFENSSLSAMLRWNISESLGPWKTKVRVREARGDKDPWVEKQGTEESQGLLLLKGFKPLTQYEFQIQVCFAEGKSKCSEWSPSAWHMSPGTAPHRQLDVWRIFRGIQKDGTNRVTVLWKALTPEDYKGVMLGHEIVYQEGGQERVHTCDADVTECNLRVSPGVKTLFVSAVTSAGKSPPAALHIAQTRLAAPCVRDLAPAGEDRVFLTWDMHRHPTESALFYIVQWQSHSLKMQWKKVAADHNSTHAEGLKPGVRFNVSLYAVTSVGASEPASKQIYSKEETPLSGPKVSVLTIEATRIQVQWEELDLDQQRGFITNYTIYMRNRRTRQQVTLAGSMSRRMWLVDVDAAFDLHVSASTSAGEGPLDGSNIGLSFVIAGLLVILANLICWNRRRIKRTCKTIGPQWLFEKFPRVENSTATKLLQEKERGDSDSFWQSVYNDPPITPVEIIPVERTNWYPSPRAEENTDGVMVAAMPSPVEPETDLLLAERHGYKPQITGGTLEEEVPEEEDPWLTPLHTEIGPISDEAGAPYSPQVCGLLRGWLSDLAQDRSSTGLSTMGGIHFKGTPQTLFSGESWLEERPAVQGDSSEGQTLLPDELVRCLNSPMMEYGPFPQGIVLHSTQNHH
ncbi:interleukin-23 receptor [Megalops cyprinoides]|uniref:interleukin-23 receptor n=1 Tax=Megalops cyprinoides TaxID=118141 RepID=UPI001864FD53|nr:interleukin-23 receptor [Megalops cyprinoides]